MLTVFSTVTFRLTHRSYPSFISQHYGIFSPERIAYERAVSSAEKIVGCLKPRNFLFNENFLNIACNLKHILDTNNPISATAKKLSVDDQDAISVPGMVILLLSKAAYKKGDQNASVSSISVYKKQKKIAEITNATILSQLIHNSINEKGSELKISSHPSEGDFENRIFALVGDYLLAKVFKVLAEIKNPMVCEYMSVGLANMIEGQILKDIGYQDPLEYWENRNFSLHGSLIANGCKSSMLLANSSADLQLAAYEFGCKFARAWILSKEINSFRDACPRKSTDLNSLPVLLSDSKFCEVFNPSVTTLRRIIVNGSSLKYCDEIKRGYVTNARNHLSILPANAAKSSLLGLLMSL